MKRAKPTNKSGIEDVLRSLGLTMTRDFVNHKWLLSNGEVFDSLKAIRRKYHTIRPKK